MINYLKSYKIYIFLFIFTLIQIPALFGGSIENAFNNNISDSLKKDAVIISENNTIEVIGKKSDFINFSITKKIKIKILTLSGVERFSKFTLPEEFDPSYISHFPPDRNYTYVFSNLKCTYFKATAITKNGEKKDIKIINTIEPVKMVVVEKNKYGNFNKYVYKIDNLNIGDEVSIEYNYFIPYLDNFGVLSSFRIFFNSDILKENYQLTISHSSELNVNINYHNNANPDSTKILNNTKVYYWNKNKLNGCIHEDGSRPYLSLPYVIFTIKPYELLYTLYGSFEEKYIPFYALYSHIREKNHVAIMASIQQGVNTKELRQIAEFVKTETEDIKNDSLGYLKLMKIHNKIADEFKFENDIAYFKDIDNFDPKMGQDINSKVIRDICRYDIYVALILKLELNYFTAYVCDKRMGEINDQYFSPMFDSDYLFAVTLKNHLIQYLYPKKANFGFYLNELPFYFENTYTRLVILSDYSPHKEAINERIRLRKLPNSKINDNVRKSNILVKINLDSLSSIFNAKINLSGQYSTLTRGLYQCNYKDETINKLYNKKISELNDQVKIISQETKVTNKEFPFQAVVNTRYYSNNLLKKNGDTISLNLNKWFNHIIYNDLDINNRKLDFYPDFCGKDSYVYYIQFNKNIKLISTFDTTEIKNEFGELTISIEQVSPDAVKISSFFVTTNDGITAGKIIKVKEIYNKIQELNNSFLLFKIE